MRKTPKGFGKKLEKIATWFASERRTNCRDCRRAFKIGPWDTPEVKKLKSKGPPCETCMPNVMEGNADAYRVFQRCADQWIFGPQMQKWALRNTAIESTMHIVGVKDRLDCLDRVKFIASKVSEVDARNRSQNCQA